MGEAEADVAGGTPVLEDAVEWGGRDVERDMGEEDDELEDAAVESKSAVISQDCLDVSQVLIGYQEWTAS